MNEKKDLHLAAVSVEGFKSVKKATVDFCPGLNIIIGKNAAGKTNLLYFLNQVLNLDYENFGSFYSSLEFKNGTDYKIIAKRNLYNEVLSDEIFPDEVHFRLLVNGLEILPDENEANNGNGPVFNLFDNNGLLYSTIFICHGIPGDFALVDKPLSIDFDSRGIPETVFNFMNSDLNSYFVKLFYSQFLFTRDRVLFSKQSNIAEIKLSISAISAELLNQIIPALKEFTPVFDVRLSENFNVTFNDKLERFSVSNLYLEFNVNDNWYLFSNLSDGTRRLFYIISEICVKNSLLVTKKRIRLSASDISQIILIEEPELGIHPHQLHKLMSFIKEQSQTKQIILTTHSPQVLDTLDNTELNRIIIAYMDNEKGTMFKKLGENEIEKAKKYMEDDYLSDYWRFSDLEKK